MDDAKLLYIDIHRRSDCLHYHDGQHAEILHVYLRNRMRYPFRHTTGRKKGLPETARKLDRFSSFGPEPTRFAKLLKPVVGRMIRSFDSPEDEITMDFWQRILDVDDQGSGTTIYSGWIAAFYFWDEDGKCLYRTSGGVQYSEDAPLGEMEDEEDDIYGEGTYSRHQQLHLSLDGVKYHKLDSEEIPSGWIQVPVKITDNGETIHSVMVAGSVGMACSSSGSKNGMMDTLQPETGWWICEKKK